MSSPSNIEQGASVVPETLLAFAKDQRYVEQVKELLARIVQIDNEEILQMSTGCLSTVLYGLLVLVRTKRTAGMAATGIEFETASRGRLLCSVLVSAGWVLGVRYACMNRNTCERLTGAARRRVFEEQRRRMIERSTAQETSPRGLKNLIRSQNVPWKHYLSRCLPALAAEPEGPHQVTTTNSNQQNYDLLVWMLRLHLALYCVNGRYASLIHRLIVRRPFRAIANQTPLVNRPKSMRGIGGLLLAQAAVTLMQTLSQKWMNLCADHRVKAMLTRPSIIHIEGSPARPSEDDMVLCAICHQPREFPACPCTCGHVFCWHCLQQWVTFNVEACPLCRRPCEKQDIVFLRNYVGEPSESNSSNIFS